MKVFLNHIACEGFTQATGIETLPLKGYERLAEPVSAHADMLINIIEENIFCYEDHYCRNKKVFAIAESLGYNVIKCKPPISSAYPYDVGLNALVIGKRIFGKADYLSNELKSLAAERGYELINVNQGYSACTTLVLNEKNVVTGDVSIKKALEKNGINVTLIKEDNIKLPGYNMGFIGGASFVLKDKIYTFGDAKKLSSYSDISREAQRLNMEIISISSGDVFDFGGAKSI